VRRRDFIKGVAGSIVLWPLTARAQSAMPVIGLLDSRGPDDASRLLAAFRQGLKDTGFVEGQNVAIEYRFADYRNERLPTLAADLVHRQVAVIAALTTPAAMAAKAATRTIPIAFEIGGDPVKLGLVASLDRPGGNVTGATQLNVEMMPKRLELLRGLVPAARVIALLVSSTDPTNTETTKREVQAAARGLGLELHVLSASTEPEMDAAFAKLAQIRADGLVIGGSGYFQARHKQLADLAARHAVPTIFETREFVSDGGLMSYGGGVTDAYRLAGVYTARILKGDKPADLPVQQATKVELYINLKTAKALGITVPLPLSGRADELFE
jgi:putative tryptophan/tyrosine transport system substrate-binding protein